MTLHLLLILLLLLLLLLLLSSLLLMGGGVKNFTAQKGPRQCSLALLITDYNDDLFYSTAQSVPRSKHTPSLL